MNTKLTATIAIAVVALMVFSTAGVTTLSWFTDTEETDITITTGSLNVSTKDFYVNHNGFELISKDIAPNTIPIIYDDGRGAITEWSDNSLLIAGDPDDVGVEIGYTVKFYGTLDYKFLVDIDCPNIMGITVAVEDTNGESIKAGVWNVPESKPEGYFELYLDVSIQISSLPMDLIDTHVRIINEIVQYLTPIWDGTANTDWYNDADSEFTLVTAEEFAGFASLIDEGNTFENKTVKLSSDLNLLKLDENGEPICFDPIGSYRKDSPFNVNSKLALK